MISNTPAPPYYAVIFTSLRTERDNGYSSISERMSKLAKLQPGFLGFESAREKVGITVSYWSSLEAIHNWKINTEHMIAQKRGQEEFYSNYKVRVCKVERDYGF